MSRLQGSNFETTRWSLILGQSGSEGISGTLEYLCECYRKPVLAFIRRQMAHGENAEDVCQDFFCHLIQKRIYRLASPQHGRFRSFLLASVKNFLKNEYRKAGRQKRGGGAPHVSLDVDLHGDHLDVASVSEGAMDSYFDRDWADSVFDQVWEGLKSDYREKGMERRFDLLRATLDTDEEALPYSELAEGLELTIDGARSAVFRLRREFRQLFRATVAQVVEKPSEIDQEIRYLLKAFSKKSSPEK